MADTLLFTDNTYGTLASGLAIDGTSITLTSGHGARFPTVSAGQILYATLLNSNNIIEEIHITAHTASSDTLTVTRAANSTTAKAWNAGDRIECRLTSEMLSVIATMGAGQTLAGDLIFTDATYDIGKSGATRPRDGFFSRNLTIGGELSTVAWTDYSATSTVTGWASTTTKQIFYKQVGKLVFVQFYIDGTSDNAVARFTVATAAAASLTQSASCLGVTMDNGSLLTTPGRVQIAAGASVVNCYKDAAAANFTASGQKIVAGQLVYEIA